MRIVPKPSTSAIAFARWIKKHKLSYATVAKDLGVSNAVISGWLSGKYRPKGVLAEKIQTYTGGAVKTAGWMSAKEQKEIQETRPFAQTG